MENEIYPKTKQYYMRELLAKLDNLNYDRKDMREFLILILLNLDKETIVYYLNNI